MRRLRVKCRRRHRHEVNHRYVGDDKMVVVIEESDGGTKKKAREAIQNLKKDFKTGNIIAKELRKVMIKIREDAKLICRQEAYDTGTLYRTIRISRIPMGVMTGGWSHVKAITIFNMSVVAGDLTKINPKTNRPCDYASWVHDGHRMRDGSFFSGVPFLTEAVAKNAAELEKAIERALKKLGKKYERYGCFQLPQN